MKQWFASERGAQFFLLLGLGLMMVFAALEWQFPAAAQLETAAGRVSWRQETRTALYFIVGQEGRYALYAKGDSDGRLRAAVRDAAGRYPISVRFDRRQASRTGLAPGDFYAAYGVAVGGKDVTALAEVRASYRRDDLVALVMGIFFAAHGARRLRVLRRLAADGPASARRAGGGKPASRRSR